MWQFGHWSLLIGLRRASSKRENKRFRERMREKEKEREKPMRERDSGVREGEANGGGVSCRSLTSENGGRRQREELGERG